MAKVRTKTVKRAARKIVEYNYDNLQPKDFDLAKKVCGDKNVARIPSKRLRNMIAGYVTRIMNRLTKGPVRGVCLSKQEAERERRDNYAPTVSEFEVERPVITTATRDMLEALGYTYLITTVDVKDRERERERRV